MADRFSRDEYERLCKEAQRLKQDAHRLLRLILLNVTTLREMASNAAGDGGTENQFCRLYRDLRSSTRLALTQLIRQLSSLVSSIEGSDSTTLSASGQSVLASVRSLASTFTTFLQESAAYVQTGVSNAEGEGRLSQLFSQLEGNVTTLTDALKEWRSSLVSQSVPASLNLFTPPPSLAQPVHSKEADARNSRSQSVVDQSSRPSLNISSIPTSSSCSPSSERRPLTALSRNAHSFSPSNGRLSTQYSLDRSPSGALTPQPSTSRQQSRTPSRDSLQSSKLVGIARDSSSTIELLYNAAIAQDRTKTLEASRKVIDFLRRLSTISTKLGVSVEGKKLQEAGKNLIVASKAVLTDPTPEATLTLSTARSDAKGCIFEVIAELESTMRRKGKHKERSNRHLSAQYELSPLASSEPLQNRGPLVLRTSIDRQASDSSVLTLPSSSTSSASSSSLSTSSASAAVTTVPDGQIPSSSEDPALDARISSFTVQDHRYVLTVQRYFRKCRHTFAGVVLRAMKTRDFRRMKKRAQTTRELIATEKNYMMQLGEFIEVYVKPIQTQKILTPLQHQELFRNVDDLKRFTMRFYSRISGRLDEWPSVSSWGEIFLESLADMLREYSEYVNGYHRSVSTFETLSTQKKLANFLQEHRSSGSLNVPSYLILPVQRLPRYEMMLEQIYNLTPEEHMDRGNLHSALKQLKELTEDIDRQTKNREKLHEIQDSVAGAPTLISSQRYFIRDGKMDCAKLKGNKVKAWEPVHCFLFSDLLLVAVPRKKGVPYNFFKALRIKEMELQTLSGSNGNLFCLLQSREDTWFRLGSSSACESWTIDIGACCYRTSSLSSCPLQL
mmetsp:Transcript_1216/g.2886  ORF Transcript_1216/g.2886 Transcript_1216/m.2886 type:complete len:841 (+) Transcript_1216:83-2605(+)